MEMTNGKPLGQRVAALPHEHEITLLDLALVLAEQRKLIIGFTAFATVASIVFALLIPPLFKSTARLMPPQQSQSAASAMLGQLIGGGAGGGGAGGGVAAALGLKNPADVHIGILKSRTLTDSIIQRFDLKNYYEEDLMQGARSKLNDNTAFTAGKDGIITIDVWDKDPQRAADMANAYIEELENLQGGLAITEAAQRRLYYEKQLKYAADKLAESRMALKSSLEEGGMVLPDAQGEALLANVASLRAQMSAKEIQVRAMRGFATENNPDLKLQQQQLNSMRQELAKLEGGSRDSGSTKAKSDDPAVLQSVQRMQEVKYYQVLFELMAKQYELARIDESRDPIVIQVIDKAVEAERKDKPKRAQIVILTMVSAFIVSVFFALVRFAIARIGADPVRAERLARLKSMLLPRGRRPLQNTQ